jgi:hypothetical protein
MNQNSETEYSISLPVNDVVLMANIISAVSKRGAFEADEMVVVGSLFERLKAHVAPKQESALELDKDQLELDFTAQ